MKNLTQAACWLAALAITLPAFAKDDPVALPIKTTVGAIRQSRDAVALKNFADDEQGKFILGDDWAKGTDAQRKEFTQLFHTLFAKMAFPAVRKDFANLDQILYQAPKIDANKAAIESTVLINHPLKKQELKLTYAMAKDGAAWKIVDVTVLGDSMLTGIRDDQVKPILKEGGWDGLLKAMRAKTAELEKGSAK